MEPMIASALSCVSLPVSTALASNLRASERPLDVGDLLESESGALRICKYVGFESAAWVIPEAKSAPQAPLEQPEQTVQI